MYFPEYNWTFKHATYQSFKKGKIKCPYEPRLCNIGYIGEGKYKRVQSHPFNVTDEEINAKIEELKKMFSESDQMDELKKLMNEFESEEAYWKYEYEVYKKSLPIEKYRIFLEKEFSEKETSEKGSEEYQNEWIKWYDTYQEDLAKEQNFIVVSEMEEGALVELLERFITD